MAARLSGPAAPRVQAAPLRALGAALGIVAIVAGCRTKARVPAATFPVRMAVDCFTPAPDDYAVTIVVRDTGFRDTTWLRPLLGGVGQHWRVETPLPRRSVDVGVVYSRDGIARDVSVTRGSGSREFDARALRAVEAAVADSARAVPSRYPGDSLRVLVRFGARDIRDAMVQTWLSVARPPRPRSGNPEPDYPVERRVGQRVVAAFVVDTLGKVDPATVTILLATDSAYARAVVEIVPRWRFTPSTVRGCRVPREMRWEFGEGPPSSP